MRDDPTTFDPRYCVTVDQVAWFLGVNKRTVRRLWRPLIGDADFISRSLLLEIVELGFLERENYLAGRHSPPRRSPTTSMRTRILVRDGEHCRYCGKKTSQRTRRIDHLLPVCEGGLTIDPNLVICCQGCNYRKGKALLCETNLKLRPSPCDDEVLWQVQRRLAEGDYIAQFAWTPSSQEPAEDFVLAT